MLLPSLQGNWIDLVILAVFLYFIIHSLSQGLYGVIADFLAFLLSLLVALRGYQVASLLLRNNFSLSNSMANALGFLLVITLVEAALHIIFTFTLNKIPEKYYIKNKYTDKFLSILPSLGEAVVVIAFLMLLVTALPINPKLKKDIENSKIGGTILNKFSSLESNVNEVFGGVIQDSLTYLTIKPGSGDTVALTTEIDKLSPDEKTEKEMFNLINKERLQNGESALAWEESLVPVARAHATDMWEQKYFSHFSPDGKDVGDRLIENKIEFMLAGENLAMAPTLATAHTGLMNSEGHRKNILDPEFGRVGVGVIDNGVYGKMFVQIFIN